jgi:hypothetical protein
MGDVQPQSSPKEDTIISSAELMFKALLTLPGEILDTPELTNNRWVQILLQQKLLPTRPLSCKQASRSVPQQLLEASLVWFAEVVWFRLWFHYIIDPTRSWRPDTRHFASRLNVMTVDCLRLHLGITSFLPASPRVRTIRSTGRQLNIVAFGSPYSLRWEG